MIKAKRDYAKARELPSSLRIGASEATLGLAPPGSDESLRHASNGIGSRLTPRPYPLLACSKGGVYSGDGIHDAPDKENGTRLDVANQEDEGAVYGDLHRGLHGH